MSANQTRLSWRIRQHLEKRADGEVDIFLKNRALLAAADLDKAAVALGKRGEAVKELRSYQRAAHFYERLTGKAYAG